MANLSEAHGRVYIKASNLKTIEDFLLIQEERNKYVYYPTDIIDSQSDISDVVSARTTQENGYYICNMWFTAEGRWCFENNIDDFFDCTLFQDTDDVFIRKMKEYVCSQDIQIKFEYVDAEASQNFVKEQEATITYNSKTKDISIDVKTIKDLPYTAENLIVYGYYECDEIVSVQFLLDYYDDYLRENEFYLKHKDEIIPILEKQKEKEEIFFFLESLESSIPELKEYVEKNKE